MAANAYGINLRINQRPRRGGYWQLCLSAEPLRAAGCRRSFRVENDEETSGFDLEGVSVEIYNDDCIAASRFLSVQRKLPTASHQDPAPPESTAKLRHAKAAVRRNQR